MVSVLFSLYPRFWCLIAHVNPLFFFQPKDRPPNERSEAADGKKLISSRSFVARLVVNTLRLARLDRANVLLSNRVKSPFSTFVIYNRARTHVFEYLLVCLSVPPSVLCTANKHVASKLPIVSLWKESGKQKGLITMNLSFRVDESQNLRNKSTDGRWRWQKWETHDACIIIRIRICMYVCIFDPSSHLL